MVTGSDIIKFQVSDEQWNLGHSIGMARYNTKNPFASTRNLSKINTHVCGAVAEAVFAEWQGFEMDTNIHQFKGDKADFISRRGESTDVKQSTFLGWDVHLKEKVENIEDGKGKDIYVLCRAIVEGERIPRVEVIGWLDYHRFIRDCNKQKERYGSSNAYPWNYVVGPGELEPFVGKKFGVEADVLLAIG